MNLENNIAQGPSELHQLEIAVKATSQSDFAVLLRGRYGGRGIQHLSCQPKYFFQRMQDAGWLQIYIGSSLSGRLHLRFPLGYFPNVALGGKTVG